MREVLVNPLKGYYMEGDVFGKQGDFVTSPEISQVFGELCGIWYLTEWMRLGRPEKTQLIEFGPGRGTLMSDMLRTLSQFPHFYKTITDVHLVEASPGLRKMQRAALVKGSGDKDVTRIEGNEHEAPIETITRQDGVRVSWHDGIEVVPDQWSFVMAHEFFDALPIHSFEKTGSEWREMMVDMDDTEESEHNFRIVKSPNPTAMTKSYLSDKKFEVDFKDGDRVDISPDCWGVMEKIAQYLDRNGGSGLAIDYGQDYIQGDTLRAIKDHKIIHPMCDPGSADLSADVDFSFLKQAILQGSGVSAYGPITQKDFLQSLGIQARIEQLFKNAKSSAARKTLLDGAERLMDPELMGRIYKVLAFSKEPNTIKEEPVGFEKKKCLLESEDK
ncbi:S-adenosyl-L-methionine-dependent methyltransferase [Mucor mucedo]|uniref:S-adenosyl-L-methionine-dependent methyltransferase n=1 Tax=Mucor mucedo TaxID=29922 RepID=UPI0022210CD3|nr:S-adenosyl-L-methionine-dependent methyltransferase [Mucor mucedo]KAI7895932.1 S-adenosyl-L-methionine-dependent methyltransferase [Mucor mucedo]